MAEVLTPELTFGRYIYGTGTEGDQVRKLIWIDDNVPPPAFNPADLLTSVQGAYYDPSDLSSMFQDAAETIPAVVDSPVGRINDQSVNANNLTQNTAAARPILRQDGALFYLEFDGVDDCLTGPFGVIFSEFEVISGVNITTTGVTRSVFNQSSGSTIGTYFRVTAAAQLDIKMQPDTALLALDVVQATDYVLGGRASAAEGVIASLNTTDTTPISTTVPTPSANSTIFMGRRGSSVVEFWLGRMYGVFIRSTVLTPAERTETRTFIGEKSGIVI